MLVDKKALPIGQKISLPGHFDEMVVLEDARQIGNGYECRVRLPDGSLEEAVISAEEAEEIWKTVHGEEEAYRPADAEKIGLLIESARIRLAYAYDRQFAVSISGIRTLPHQIEAVYQKMLPQPRLRFLLADDPGAGKTIMAGLLIKEMKLREAIERILILCPAPLTIQWQDEMLRGFGESFDMVFSAVDQHQLTNPWQRCCQIIASIDYAKQEDVRERVWEQNWDLIIIDEAHKCSARTVSGGQDRELKVRPTKRYELAFKLADRGDHILLLTATPHHGDDDKFAHFLRLIDPDLFVEPHHLGEQSASVRKDIFRLGENCPWALRRLKEDLKDLDGKRLFPDRHANTVTFKLNSEEYALYKEVTAYINQFIPQQTGQRRSSAALARTVLQRRLASSACAIHESIKRRLKTRKELLEKLEQMTPAQLAKHFEKMQGRMPDTEVEDDDLDEKGQDDLLDDYACSLELERIRAEISVLQDLEEKACRVRENANDSKLQALRECLARAQFSELKDGRGKLLIFTEHRDTMNYISAHLEKWGYSVCNIHGGMNVHERKRAQETFRTKAQICAATEAAGEGINLQFCHLMINYDMPWNPTRLEQRLGRIHRIGQDRDVYVFNFVATDSEDGQPVIEGRILNILLVKLEQMRAALHDRVFDVIGEVMALNEVNLPEILRDAAFDPRRLDEYIDQIEKMDPGKLKEYEESTGIALARSYVDFSDFQKRNLDIEERRLMPRYVESHFHNACEEVGLKIEPRADGLWRIEHVLASLRSERLESARKAGKPEASYRKITFHKMDLEKDAHVDAVLMGPGHALYAAVDEKLNEMLVPFQGKTGVFIDNLASESYKLHFFELSIRGKDTRGSDVSLYGELVAAREEKGHLELFPAEMLLDLVPHPSPPEKIEKTDPQPASDFIKSGYQMGCRDRCRSEREHFSGIIREYLEKSFKVRKDRAQEKAMRLMAEAGKNPDFKLAADEAMKNVTLLESSRQERLKGLERLKIARTGPVRHIASLLVYGPGMTGDEVPDAVIDEIESDLKRRSELAAEQRVINELIKEGFPEDRIERVGHLKLGFDIRAHRVIDKVTGTIEVRRIEVKGRNRGMPVRLTINEWYKAQQLAHTYWLAVVWDPLKEGSELVTIQNPAEKLDYAKKEIVAARFYEIPAEAIKREERK